MTEEWRQAQDDALLAKPETTRDEPEPHGDGRAGETADLLSIGLLVFFVSLLVIVAALVAIPAVFR